MLLSMLLLTQIAILSILQDVAQARHARQIYPEINHEHAALTCMTDGAPLKQCSSSCAVKQRNDCMQTLSADYL